MVTKERPQETNGKGNIETSQNICSTFSFTTNYTVLHLQPQQQKGFNEKRDVVFKKAYDTNKTH